MFLSWHMCCFFWTQVPFGYLDFRLTKQDSIFSFLLAFQSERMPVRSLEFWGAKFAVTLTLEAVVQWMTLRITMQKTKRNLFQDSKPELFSLSLGTNPWKGHLGTVSNNAFPLALGLVRTPKERIWKSTRTLRSWPETARVPLGRLCELKEEQSVLMFFFVFFVSTSWPWFFDFFFFDNI